MNKYEETLLAGWEDLHKKGQLSMWILLALKDGPKSMPNIKGFVNGAIQGRLETDDRSMYRTLRRFAKAQVATFSQIPSKTGPPYKVYELTDTGRRVLQAFLQRNIITVFYSPHIKELISKE